MLRLISLCVLAVMITDVFQGHPHNVLNLSTTSKALSALFGLTMGLVYACMFWRRSQSADTGQGMYVSWRLERGKWTALLGVRSLVVAASGAATALFFAGIATHHLARQPMRVDGALLRDFRTTRSPICDRYARVWIDGDQEASLCIERSFSNPVVTAPADLRAGPIQLIGRESAWGRVVDRIEPRAGQDTLP